MASFVNGWVFFFYLPDLRVNTHTSDLDLMVHVPDTPTDTQDWFLWQSPGTLEAPFAIRFTSDAVHSSTGPTSSWVEVFQLPAGFRVSCGFPVDRSALYNRRLPHQGERY